MEGVRLLNFRTLEWWDVVLQKRLAWAVFVLLLSTLVCWELIWVFLFHKFSNFTPPPPRVKMLILLLQCGSAFIDSTPDAFNDNPKSLFVLPTTDNSFVDAMNVLSGEGRGGGIPATRLCN